MCARNSVSRSFSRTPFTFKAPHAHHASFCSCCEPAPPHCVLVHQHQAPPSLGEFCAAEFASSVTLCPQFHPLRGGCRQANKRTTHTLKQTLWMRSRKKNVVKFNTVAQFRLVQRVVVGGGFCALFFYSFEFPFGCTNRILHEFVLCPASISGASVQQ